MPKSFYNLLTASGFGNLCDGLLLVVLPLYAATQTRNPAEISALLFAAMLPWLMFSPFAGVLVDRYNRKNLMVFVSLFRCFLLFCACLIIFWQIDGVFWLYMLAFLLGCAEVIFDTVSATILPSIVSTEELEEANRYLAAVQFVTNDFLGKSLAGFLFSVTPWAPFFLQSLLHGGAAKAIYQISVPLAYKPITHKRQPLYSQIATGFRVLWHHPVLRTLSLLSVVRNILESGATAVLVLYALELLQLDEVGYGLLLSCAAVGGIVAAFFVQYLLAAWGSGNTLVIAIFLAGITFAVISFFPNTFVVAVMLFLFTMTEVVWNVVSTSFRQSVVPSELLGRVNASWRLTSRGTRSVGAIMGGVIAAAFGLTVPFLLMGLGGVIMSILTASRINNRAFEAGRDHAVVGD